MIFWPLGGFWAKKTDTGIGFEMNSNPIFTLKKYSQRSNSDYGFGTGNPKHKIGGFKQNSCLIKFLAIKWFKKYFFYEKKCVLRRLII